MQISAPAPVSALTSAAAAAPVAARPAPQGQLTEARRPHPDAVGQVVVAFPLNFMGRGLVDVFTTGVRLSSGGVSEWNGFDGALKAARLLSAGKGRDGVGVFQREHAFTVEPLLIPDVRTLDQHQGGARRVPLQRQALEADGRPGWGSNLLREVVGTQAIHGDLRAIVDGEVLPVMSDDEMGSW